MLAVSFLASCVGALILVVVVAFVISLLYDPKALFAQLTEIIFGHEEGGGGPPGTVRVPPSLGPCAFDDVNKRNRQRLDGCDDDSRTVGPPPLLQAAGGRSGQLYGPPSPSAGGGRLVGSPPAPSATVGVQRPPIAIHVDRITPKKMQQMRQTGAAF